MKHVIAGLVLAFLAVAGAVAQDFDAERKRIRRERAEAQERFEAEEKACYGRFAVTDCLEAARKRRNTTVNALRREEVALNDAERQRRAGERPPAAPAPQAGPPAGPVAAPSTDRRPNPAPADPPAPRGKPRTQAAFESPQVDAAQAARNREAFEARRRQAQEHKADVLERNAKREKPRAADLPPPKP